ncbi:universal stress protein [Nitratireductor indicus]|uniref:universal stress protein n=1 Tax=Nitratireductor indicus TaxID=721133 RepID=UPI000A3090C6
MPCGSETWGCLCRHSGCWSRAAAHEAGAGLVVVGSCGRNGIEKMVLGSVAEELLRVADVDVLVIPSAA